MYVLTSVLPVLSLVLGWVLNELGARRRARLEANRRLYDAKLEAYAQWMSAMEVLMQTWTSGNGPRRTPELGVLRKKLELLEADPETRSLFVELDNCLPIEGSSDFHFMGMAAHSTPEFDWPPFREKIGALIERVRASKPD